MFSAVKAAWALYTLCMIAKGVQDACPDASEFVTQLEDLYGTDRRNWIVSDKGCPEVEHFMRMQVEHARGNGEYMDRIADARANMFTAEYTERNLNLQWIETVSSAAVTRAEAAVARLDTARFAAEEGLKAIELGRADDAAIIATAKNKADYFRKPKVVVDAGPPYM